MIFNMADKTGGGGSVTITPLSVTQNGTYTAPTGEAYSPVTVNVSGGGGEAKEKDVNFYDYDGTRVYSYTKADFLALAAMPSNPDHSTDTIPLTSQGWNWTLADAKTYVTAYGMLDIGQMYTPTDGKTHILIEIPQGAPSAQLTFYVRYTQSVSQGVTVDWGDGNSETFTGTSATNRSHTYAAPEKYDITLKVTSGTLSLVGSSSNSIYGGSSPAYNRSRIHCIHVASNVSLGAYIFASCVNLEKISLPSTITSLGNYTFRYCYKLKALTVPSSVTSVPNYLCANAYGLRHVCMPKGITSIGQYAFDSNYSNERIMLPASVTTVGMNACYYCYINKSVIIPPNVDTINAQAFNSNYSIPYVRLYPTTPPTLANANALSGIPTETMFIVPKASKATYQSASNWSTYSSRIIGDDEV